MWHSAAYFEISNNISVFYPASGFAMWLIALWGLNYLPVFAVAIIIGAMPEHFPTNYGGENVLQFARQLLVYGGGGGALNFVFKA